MGTLLDPVRGELAALFAADLGALSRAEVASLTVEWWRLMDRGQAFSAQVLREADRCLVHVGSGYRDVTEWAAAMSNTARGQALAALEISDTLERAPALLDAVEETRRRPDAGEPDPDPGLDTEPRSARSRVPTEPAILPVMARTLAR